MVGGRQPAIGLLNSGKSGGLCPRLSLARPHRVFVLAAQQSLGTRTNTN